jgi:cytochrome b pre-mRNA-processing protein 3
MFKKFFNRFQNKRDVYLLYSRIVEQARTPAFYQDLDVEDSLDGRFDMILLHLFLLLQRLEEEGEAEMKLQRQLQEAFVTDMDRSLREMGVGDMSVGKQIKKMSVAWFGRAEAYRQALAADDSNELLEAALNRNVYSDDHKKSAVKLALYVRACCEALTQQTVHDIKTKPIFANVDDYSNPESQEGKANE